MLLFSWYLSVNVCHVFFLLVAINQIAFRINKVVLYCIVSDVVLLLLCRSVSTIRNQRYHIHANLSFALLVAEILLLISARFDPGTVSTQIMLLIPIILTWLEWFLKKKFVMMYEASYSVKMLIVVKKKPHLND